MKKLKSTLLFCCIAIFLICTTLLSSAAVDTSYGIMFNNEGKYTAQTTLKKLPLTLEATVYFKRSAPTNKRGGVVIGNYTDDNTQYFNFEFTPLGSPRIRIQNSSMKKFDFIFDKVNVMDDKWSKVAITLDTTNKVASCYVNGELKQTLDIPTDIGFVNITANSLNLGADNTIAVKECFKGILKDLTLYSDVRTAQEIISDYTAKEIDQDNLLGYYDFSDNSTGIEPRNISCKYQKGPTFYMKKSWLTTKNPLEDYAYSFAIVGDTQSLTYHYPDKLSNIYNWILANKDEKKIKFVVGLGDFTDKNNETEWIYSKSQLSKLNGIIPFSFVRGNHDSIDSYTKHFTKALFGKNLSGSLDNTIALAS